MMKKILIFFIILAALQDHARAQDRHKIDSLQNELRKFEVKKKDMGKKVTTLLDSTKVNILNQIGHEYLYSDFDTAIYYTQQFLYLSERIGFKKGIGDAYNNMGIINNNIGNYLLALEYYQKALKIYEEISCRKGMGNSNSGIGLLYYKQGNYAEALKYCLIALKMQEEIGDKQGLGNSYTDLANIYEVQDNYSEALRKNFSALKIQEEIGDKNGMARSYLNIAYEYNHQGKYYNAIKNIMSCLKISEEIGNKQRVGDSYFYLGGIYKAQKNYSEALKNHLLSLKIKKEIRAKGINVSASYCGIGEIYETQGNLNEALKYVKKGLALSLESGAKEQIQAAYEELAVINAKLQNYRVAYDNEVLFKQYHDSLFNTENEKKLTSLQMKYDFDKKEQADSIQHASENKINLLNLHKQVAYTRIGVAGFILVVLLLFFVFRNYTNQRKATAQMAIARQRAEQSEKFKEQFLANMSHEIRTPMNAVMGMTNLVLDSPLNEKQRFYLEGVRKSSETLLRIINDILDLSKIEAGKMEMENIDFSLPEVLDQVKQTLQHKAEEKGLQLIVDIDHQVPEVLMGDPVRLNQILMNLAGNAIKFTERGSVTISVGGQQSAVSSRQSAVSGWQPEVGSRQQAIDSQQLPVAIQQPEVGSQQATDDGPRSAAGSPVPLKFSVTDTGIGIPEDKLQTVFESFSQAKASDTRRFGGTGLGLTISKQLVELMDGKISVESREGSGTTFSFEITCQPGSVSRLNESKSADQIDASVLDGLKILLADDNEYNRIVTSDTLRSRSKVEITEATNGREAVDLLSQQDFDLVLMDVQMPIMDGYEATRYIRENFSSPKNDLPIIALTASVIRSDLDKCRAAGMNDYIPKPFKTSQLISVIAKAASREVKFIEPKNIEMKNENEKIRSATDLAYLEKFCEGDKIRMQKYIDMFLASAPSLVENLYVSLKNNDCHEIASHAHGHKAKLIMMGMNKAIELAAKIEMDCRQGNGMESIKINLLKLVQEIETAMSELKVV